LGLSTRVEVFGGRAEVFLRKHRVESVVARAVGKVEKIFGWIQECSTWNKLILLKGPGWIEEWQEFEGSKFRKKLRVVGEHRYQVGASEKSRVIIALERT
jgi:16S rRNA G527 N7-methylase RsmG